MVLWFCCGSEVLLRFCGSAAVLWFCCGSVVLLWFCGSVVLYKELSEMYVL